MVEQKRIGKSREKNTQTKTFKSMVEQKRVVKSQEKIKKNTIFVYKNMKMRVKSMVEQQRVVKSRKKLHKPKSSRREL